MTHQHQHHPTTAITPRSSPQPVQIGPSTPTPTPPSPSPASMTHPTSSLFPSHRANPSPLGLSHASAVAIRVQKKARAACTNKIQPLACRPSRLAPASAPLLSTHTHMACPICCSCIGVRARPFNQSINHSITQLITRSAFGQQSFFFASPLFTHCRCRAAATVLTCAVMPLCNIHNTACHSFPSLTVCLASPIRRRPKLTVRTTTCSAGMHPSILSPSVSAFPKLPSFTSDNVTLSSLASSSPSSPHQHHQLGHQHRKYVSAPPHSRPGWNVIYSIMCIFT